jgi:hypothetical protein
MAKMPSRTERLKRVKRNMDALPAKKRRNMGKRTKLAYGEATFMTGKTAKKASTSKKPVSKRKAASAADARHIRNRQLAEKSEYGLKRGRKK